LGFVSTISGSGISAVVNICLTTNSGRNNISGSTSNGPSYTVRPAFIVALRSICFVARRYSRLEVSLSIRNRASSKASKIFLIQIAVSGSMSSGGP